MEGVPNQERTIDITEVTELLRVRGIDDQEVKKLVIKWTIQQETLVTQEGTAVASITFNMNRADLYLAAGDFNGAWEALEEARLQAHQENEIELYSQIMSKMDEIDK